MKWTDCTAIEQSDDVLSGAPVVRGSRVPVSAIFENIEGGATVEEVVEWFPGITIDDVREVLRFVASSAAA